MTTVLPCVPTEPLQQVQPPEAELAALQVEVHQLQAALAHRETIDVAKGVVMAHAGCDATRAFQLLRKLSNDHNVKVAVLAAAMGDVVGAHALNTSPGLAAIVRDFLAGLAGGDTALAAVGAASEAPPAS